MLPIPKQPHMKPPKLTNSQKNENSFLDKPLGKTLRLLRNGILAAETKTAVENGVFRLVAVSTPFFVINVACRHVSGNIVRIHSSREGKQKLMKPR